jgi:hypothetical protein
VVYGKLLLNFSALLSLCGECIGDLEAQMMNCVTSLSASTSSNRQGRRTKLHRVPSGAPFNIVPVSHTAPMCMTLLTRIGDLSLERDRCTERGRLPESSSADEGCSHCRHNQAYEGSVC